MISGASAKRGDCVRNLTTDETGTMTDPMQSGRIIVDDCQKWERWNIEVVSDVPDVSVIRTKRVARCLAIIGRAHAGNALL